MAADFQASVVAADRDELEADVVAHVLDFSNSPLNDDEEEVVLAVPKSLRMSDCLLQSPTTEAASAKDLYQDEQVVKTVACFACW